jgi:uncharacterized delta-60 repeat protein
VQSIQKWTVLAAAIALSVTTLSVTAAPGDLDTSFGTGGHVMTSVQGSSGADTVIVDAKQRIVVAGSSTDTALSRMSPTLLRYLPDGTLDTSFGDARNGMEFLTPAGGLGDYADFCCVRLDSQNRIIAAGFTEFPSPTGAQQVITVARFSEDGVLDQSFGNNGVVANVIAEGETTSRAQSLAIDAFDRILVGGATFAATYIGTPVLVRYDTDGRLDHTFGNAGVVTIPENGFVPAPIGIAFDTAGRVLAAGSSGLGSYIVRYFDNGSADSTFGVDGMGVVELDAIPAAAFALDASDRPLLASAIIDGSYMGVMRLTPDGVADTSFGPNGNGVVSTPDELIFPHSMTIDRDGNVIVAAVEEDGYGTPIAIAVLRYTGDGLSDSSFGADGVATPALPDFPFVSGVAVDDAITIAGYATDETGGYQFTTARLQN